MATQKNPIEKAIGGKGKPLLTECAFIKQPGNEDKRDKCPDYPSQAGTMCRICGFKTPGHRGQL